MITDLIFLAIGFACGAVFGSWNKKKVQDALNILQAQYDKITNKPK